MSTKFEYDETGNTYYYVFLTFLGFILIPCTYFFWPFSDPERSSDAESKQNKFLLLKPCAKETIYWQQCTEKMERLRKVDPWFHFKRIIIGILLFLGWICFAVIIYQIMQFDYEMANFDPYEILGVSIHASVREIKKKYHIMSLKYHPDKPTGNERLFMKLTKAYNALTDDVARYNWEHFGNPDGPQAMQFGIGLPSWIVEEKNSIWVLGIYTLIFMIGLPTAVYYWWSNSIKFSGDKVLLDTTQLYYYFFHKTPNMMLKRVLMVLAASMEFDKMHNSEIVERPTDNTEIPQLMKHLPKLGINNKEKPLCFGFSVKARALLFAHLSRICLPFKTLHLDRLYIVQKCPFLIQEMVTSISQLILLAHTGRIGRLPTLDTIENAMRLSPMIVQALWSTCSPLLQLPHLEPDMLKHFFSRKRNIRSLQQLAHMKDAERRSLMRSLSDNQYKDVIRVLSTFPLIKMEVVIEVIDDVEHHVITAGAIVTVTVLIKRKTMESVISGKTVLHDVERNEMCADVLDDNEMDNVLGNFDDGKVVGPVEEEGKSTSTKPVWKKNQKKKGGKKPLDNGGGKHKSGGKSKVASKTKTLTTTALPEDACPNENGSISKESTNNIVGAKEKFDGGSEVLKKDGDCSGSEGGTSDGGESEDNSVKSPSKDEDLDEAAEEMEWQKIQKSMNKRDKGLIGRCNTSHSVHCPYFTDDKQEYWWCYIADRRNHALITPPTTITSLVDEEECELKFAAPMTPGLYTYTVCVRSDSFLGLDILEDIKLEVEAARRIPKVHPQWEFDEEDEDDTAAGKSPEGDGSSDEFATDDDAGSSLDEVGYLDDHEMGCDSELDYEQD